jgi:hypothetical protein
MLTESKTRPDSSDENWELLGEADLKVVAEPDNITVKMLGNLGTNTTFATPPHLEHTQFLRDIDFAD